MLSLKMSIPLRYERDLRLVEDIVCSKANCSYLNGGIDDTAHMVLVHPQIDIVAIGYYSYQVSLIESFQDGRVF